MIPFNKFRRVLELREADRQGNAALISEIERLKQENKLLRDQIEGKIYDV